MTAVRNAEYPILFLNSSLRKGGIESEPRLQYFTGRHTVSLPALATERITNPQHLLSNRKVEGVVISMSTGLPDLVQLRFSETALSHHLKVWFYWPGESAIECVDRDRLRSHMRHLMAAKVWETIRPAARLAYSLRTRVLQATGSVTDEPVVKNCREELDRLIAEAKPVPFEFVSPPSTNIPLRDTGFYLRTDFWAPLTSGGSYAHTCYVAQSLARTVDELICLIPSDYPLLREMGLQQVIMPAPSVYSGEVDLLSANRHYYMLLQSAADIVTPAFIYERLCLGNYSAARMSMERNIPYILEYNGSEIVMSRTFEGHRFQYEDLFNKAEDVAFRQATLISVVSDPLKEDLIARGVPSAKILVSPNGVDPNQYAPPSESERMQIRRQLGFIDSEMVVGFTGTFGGWHGIEILAEAIPQICKRRSDARFLLIGDGSYKHLIDSTVQQHGVADQVVCTGRVPQQEGARLLKACDIFVSPHSRVMSNGKFFGSPTKLFEYMSVGGGIVASDLDQIGEVLSPALTASRLNGLKVPVDTERAVLCQPGAVAEFVNAVEYLIRNPDTAKALGRNARKAALASYTWDAQVQKMWQFASPTGIDVAPGNSRAAELRHNRAHAADIQNAWALVEVCRAKTSRPHTLQWYVEMETDRRTTHRWLETLPFEKYSGQRVLEIGIGIGTDILQFAKHGANVTYLNPSTDQLEIAQENFKLHNLTARFLHGSVQELPATGEFDLVYCSEFSYLSDPEDFVRSVSTMLAPGGRVIVVAFNEHSYRHWIVQFLRMGMIGGLLSQFSMAEINSREYAGSGSGINRAVDLYTLEQLRLLFGKFFNDVQIHRRNLLNYALIVEASNAKHK